MLETTVWLLTSKPGVCTKKVYKNVDHVVTKKDYTEIYLGGKAWESDVIAVNHDDIEEINTSEVVQ